MRDAAQAFVASLSGAERGRATFAFDDDAERTDWHYIPRPRPGLPLRDMASATQTLAYHLLRAALSLDGYAKATAIVSLELVLDEIEGRGRRRDPGLYFVSIFGSPDDDRWGWRFEGHHVSVNCTVVDDVLAGVPLFLGANPARLAVAPLAAEEDQGRALARAKPGSVIGDTAPDDILTTNAAQVADAALEPLGAPVGGDLARLYLGRLASPPPAPPTVHFAWGGGLEPGQGHYYRLQGDCLLVEYDNTQDGANHVHTVVRDPGHDFGAGLLRAHLERHH